MTRASPESDFQRTIIELAELQGWLCYHVARVKGQLRANTSPGFPDLVMVRSGRLIFAELKVGKNKPTDAQEAWITRLRVVQDHGSRVEIYVWRPEDWPKIEVLLARRRLTMPWPEEVESA